MTYTEQTILLKKSGLLKRREEACTSYHILNSYIYANLDRTSLNFLKKSIYKHSNDSYSNTFVFKFFFKN